MANNTDFVASAAPTIYFYVNKNSEQVDFVSMYTIFGITVRPKGKPWTMGTRSDLDPYYTNDYEIWMYDYDSEEEFDVAELDPEDDDSWEVPPVQTWAKGDDLSREDVSKVARLVNEGNYISREEASEIPEG